jgi:pimeloyl-ACP methyl ester carboxylesterase
MYYEDQDFTDPWRTPEAVILHHGNAKNSQTWYAWVPLLARQYRVVRPDARGYGRSTIPLEGYNWSVTNFTTDLLRLLDHLQLEKVHLVGDSVGGTISLHFAYEYPERVRSVTVSSSPYKFAPNAFAEANAILKAEGTEAWARKTASNRMGQPGEVDPALREWYVQQMGRTSRRVVLETLAYVVTQDLTDTLRKIKTPTLILAAENRAPKDMAALIPGARVAEIPNTSGFVHNTAPEKCVAAWKEFVGSLNR